MPNKTTDHEIRARIDSFLTELSGLVRKAAGGFGRGRAGTAWTGETAALRPSRSGPSAQGRASLQSHPPAVELSDLS